MSNKNIRVNANIDRLLDELKKKRSEECALISTKSGIVAELVMKQHAKECKK